MADISRTYIPKRIGTLLHGIYSSRVSVISAPDGSGKSTLLREFIARTRPEGISLRYITSAANTGDCFSQICALITGEEHSEPLSDAEFASLSALFSAAAPKRPLLIVADCGCAGRTLMGNSRTARLLSECSCARFVFVCPSLKQMYRELVNEMRFLLIERDSLSMNISEVAEYAARCGVNADPREVYDACRGSFLGTRLCFMLAQRGERFSNSTSEGRLIRAVLYPQSPGMLAALIAAAAFPGLPEEFLCDLRSFSAITEHFGAEIFGRAGVIREIERLRETIPLAEANRRSSVCRLHPLLRHAVYEIFFELPQGVQHDLRICFARQYNRTGQSFLAFMEYFLAGEHKLSAEVYARDRISYFMLMRSAKLLLRYVTECPLECRAAIPRIMRMNALLLHTDLKPLLIGRFDEMIGSINSARDIPPADRQRLISYAYALKTNEDFYTLDKMGANVMRAYELFKIRREYEAPKFPWTMYAPSVFCLVHRRGYSLQTENAQFTRYQRMYNEMLNHGKYTQMIFTGEMRYYQGDLTGARELLSAAASFCSVREQGATRLAALYAAAKCCLYLGDYEGFREKLFDIHDTERAHVNAEEGECAKLCLGLLRALRGGSADDMWYGLCAEGSDLLFNRYTAPYFAMIRAAYYLRSGRYDALSERTEQFIHAADAAGNEAMGITLRLCAAQASLSLGSCERAEKMMRSALEAALENGIPSVLGEFCAPFPDIFEQMKPLMPERFDRLMSDAVKLGAEFRRGCETVRTYEITYMANMRHDNFAEHYLVPLERLISSTQELRNKLGLSESAYKFAIMAASGISNREICRLFDVTEDSVKSSLKRTCAALGVKNRRGLVGIVPAIK